MPITMIPIRIEKDAGHIYRKGRLCEKFREIIDKMAAFELSDAVNLLVFG